jgi:hypothetical protein
MREMGPIHIWIPSCLKNEDGNPQPTKYEFHCSNLPVRGLFCGWEQKNVSLNHEWCGESRALNQRIKLKVYYSAEYERKRFELELERNTNPCATKANAAVRKVDARMC